VQAAVEDAGPSVGQGGGLLMVAPRAR
jgi:hypothetical protein